MSKKVKFVVELEFEDSISDDNEIKEIAKNIAEALKHAANTYGLAPEKSETFTKSVIVSERGLELSTIKII